MDPDTFLAIQESFNFQELEAIKSSILIAEARLMNAGYNQEDIRQVLLAELFPEAYEVLN